MVACTKFVLRGQNDPDPTSDGFMEPHPGKATDLKNHKE